jgi:hypothetical protein
LDIPREAPGVGVFAVEVFKPAVLLVIRTVIVFNGFATDGHGKPLFRYELGVQHLVAPRHGTALVLCFQTLRAALFFK